MQKYRGRKGGVGSYIVGAREPISFCGEKKEKEPCLKKKEMKEALLCLAEIAKRTK